MLLAAARFEVTQGKLRGVVECLPSRFAECCTLFGDSCIVEHFFYIEHGLFGRFKHGVHAADDTHGENDVWVFAPLEEVAEDIVGYAPDKGYNFVVGDFVHEMLFSGNSEVNGIQGIRKICVNLNIGKRFELVSCHVYSDGWHSMVDPDF